MGAPRTLLRQGAGSAAGGRQTGSTPSHHANNSADSNFGQAGSRAIQHADPISLRFYEFWLYVPDKRSPASWFI
jgi:hypothetical protein